MAANQPEINSTNPFRAKFHTPKELDENGIISLVKQWQERKAGRLKFLRIGTKKILYTEQHLAEYFANCESTANQIA